MHCCAVLNTTGVLDVGRPCQEACVCSEPHGQHRARPGTADCDLIGLEEESSRHLYSSVAVVLHRTEGVLLFLAV